MNTAPEPHVIVVKLDCDGSEHPGEPHSELNGDDCFSSAIECPGVGPLCQMWMQCGKTECEAQGTDEWPDDTDGRFHGVDHKWLPGLGWATAEAGSCFYRDCDDTCDAISDLSPLPPGRYPVEVDVDEHYPVFRLMTAVSS